MIIGNWCNGRHNIYLSVIRYIEEEAIDEEEETKEFVEYEDYIIRMTIQQLGSSDAVLDLLAQRLSRKSSDLKARYEFLVNRDNKTVEGGSKPGNVEFDMSSLFDKDLEAALDSFDNLFCRRCLVFDCKLHGCSQDLIFPAEKHCTLNRMDEEKVPCGPNCYRRVQKVEGNVVTSPNEQKSARSSDGYNNNVQTSRKKSNSRSLLKKRLKSSQSESSESESRPVNDGNSKSKLEEKRGTRQRNSKRIADHVMVAIKKRQKKLSVTAASDSDSESHKETEEANSSSSLKVKSKSLSGKRGRRRKDSFVPTAGDTSLQCQVVSDCHPLKEINSDEKWKKEEFVDESISRQESIEFKNWNTIEKSLFEKGLEIFGRNSCLIARNLMNGMKTCAQVFYAMNSSENKLSSQGGDHLD